MAEIEKNELIVVSQLNAVEIFTGPQGVEKILADIEAKVAAHVPDVTTPKGRKEIASVAYKVSQSKVLLDDLGKNLVADWKQKAALVDASRKTARDRLDALRDKTREPLDIWEAEEEKRIAAEKLAKEIADAHEAALAEHALFLRAKEIERKEAEIARIEAERIAKEEAERKDREEKEEAELAAKLMKEQVEREEAARVANEERIRRESEEKAKREAEEAAAAAIKEAERKEREAKEAAEKAERDRKAAEEKAEADRVAAIKKAEEEKAAAVAAAEEKARIEAERKEQSRLAAEKAEREKAEAERKEAERKAADIEHRRAINNEVMAGLVAAGAKEQVAKQIITAIVGGMIKHVSIKY